MTTKDEALQGLAAYLRCEAGGVFQGHPSHETLMQWAREVDAITAIKQVQLQEKCAFPEVCPDHVHELYALQAQQAEDPVVKE